MKGSLWVALLAPALLSAAEDRPRARDLGLRPGSLPPGAHNAITDVPLSDAVSELKTVPESIYGKAELVISGP